MISNSVKHFTACDEHAPMQRLVSELLTGNYAQKYQAGIFHRNQLTDCADCRALTHQAILNYAQAQARRKVSARTEGKWWYEMKRARCHYGAQSAIEYWQRRYDAYMKATRDWAVSS